MKFDSQNSKRISYILATKNRAEYLKKALLNARSFVEPKDELILIDGLSSDDTAVVIADNADFINIYLSEQDTSSENAYNKGILLAQGKYIINLFDDDTLDKDSLEKAIDIFEQNSDIDILSCGGIKHYNTRKKKLTRPFYYPPGTNYGKKPEDIAKHGGCFNGVIIRRSAFAKSGLYPTDYKVAWDLGFLAQAIYRGCNVKFCRINVFDHYIHDNCMSEKFRHLLNTDRDHFIKLYCARNFVRKHELKNLGLIRFLKPVWYLNIIGYVFRNILLGRKDKQRTAPQEYIWDGGFS